MLDIGDTASDIVNVTASSGGLFSSFKKTTGAIKTAVSSLGLFSSVGATATTLLTTGMVGLIAGVVAYDKYQTAATKKHMQESRETIKTLENEIATEKQRVNSVRDIAKEYDTLKSKSNLTSKEQERYLELTKEVAQAFPELVSGYNESGDPILKLNGSLETYMGNLDKAIAKQQRLLDSEENKLADEWEKKLGEMRAEELKTKQSNFQYDLTPASPYDQNGNFDAKSYEKDLKRREQEEKKWYEDRLAYIDEKEQAISEVREKYRNQLQKDSYYKNSSETDQMELDSMLDSLNLYDMGADKAKKFTDELAKQGEIFVTTTEEMGKHKDKINEIEQKYRDGKTTLKEYTDEMIKAYDSSDNIDLESFKEWQNQVQSYAQLKGDISAVNGEIDRMGKLLEKKTGIDDSLWKEALTVDIEPIEIAEQKLDSFLERYNTGIQNLGKGGLADKLEQEFQALRDLPTEIANEALENGVISKEFILEATVDSPTPIKNLVSAFLDDEVIDMETELPVLLDVITEISEEGDITSETEQKLRDLLPDEIEDEIISSIKVQTDVQAEQDIDKFLKQRDELKQDIEAEIRMHVEGKEEAEDAYNAILKIPEEKRLNAISNYGQIKDEAYQLGVSLEGIPTEKLINIAANLDDKGLDMFITMLDQVDNKTVSAFLETEGAMEALAKCESVQQMLDLINGETSTAQLEVEDGDAKNKVEATKQSLESITGHYQVDFMVQSDSSQLDYIEGKIYEIDGKTYICTFNVDTSTKELVEFNGEINKVPESKTSKITVEADSSSVETVKSNVESIGDVKVQPEVTPVVKEEAGGLLGKIKSLFGGKSGSQTIEVTARVSQVDISSISNIKVNPIKLNVEVDTAKIASAQSTLNSIKDKTVKVLVDSSNATSKISNVKSGLTSIKDKTVKILADSSNAMSKISNVKSGLAGIKDKTVTIKANASQAISAINSVKSGLAGIRNKTVSVNVTKTTTERTITQSASANTKSTPMLSNSSLASVPVSASASLSDVPVTTSDTPSLANTSVSASASNSFGGTIDANKILKSLDFDISHIKNLEEALKRLESQLDLIDKKSEVTFGREKVRLLESQIPLLRQQQQIQEQIAKNERAQNNELIYWLNNQGFTFDSMGNILNYNDKLYQMEQNVESLKQKYDSLNSANEKNESAVKSANNAYESANDTLSKTKKYLDEYFATNNQEITEASAKWYEYEASIRAVNEELEELRRFSAIEPLKNSLQEIEYLLDRQSDRLDLLDTQYEKVSGAEKVEYLIRKQKILNEQLQIQEEAHKRIYNLAEGLQNDLWKFGFKVDEESLISNYDEVLNKLVGTDQYELAKEYADEYMEIVRGDLIDIQKEAYETKNALSDMTEEMQEALAEAREQRLEKFKNTLQEVQYEIDRITDRLELLDVSNERSKGKSNIDYLYNKIALLNDQVKASEQEFDALYNLIEESQKDLWQYGFRVDESSLITNYDDVLNELIGTEKYENAKNIADEYMNLMRDDYTENKSAVLELENEIKNLQDELAKAEREMALFSSNNRITELNEEFEELSDNLDVVNSKLEYAFGTDKVNLMREEIELLNKQLELQADKLETASSQMQVYTNDLSKYGFTFDMNGDISNYSEVMENYRDDEQVENIKELCEEYMNLRDEIRDLSSEYVNLENSVKDAYNEMLDATKEIEDELTDVIKKSLEERKKEQEKYTNERIKLLEKEKSRIEELWQTQDYEKSVEEQAKEISDLQQRINILANDTSLSGQQKLKELTKQLEDAQKELAELTENKIREDYTNNIDKEIERLEEENQIILDALDEKFSDTNIAKIVAEALQTGFLELNGEMQSVQDVLINSINESAQGYSVMSEIIKNQLVANLNVALGTTKELANIYKELDLNEYGKISALGNVVLTSPEVSGGNTNNVSFGDTVINVSGIADSTTVEQIEEMIKQSQEEMLDKLTRDL